MAKRRAVTKSAARKVGQAEDVARNTALREEIASGKKTIAAQLWASVADKPVPNAKAATMLRDLYGKAPGSKGAGRPDTAAAAEGLGVSRRTVQKWIKEGLPNSRNAERLREQWAASPAARRRQISPARRAKILNKAGGSIIVKAQFVVSGPDASSREPRPVNIDSFGYDQRKEMVDALIEDDEEAAYEAFINGLQTDFGGSVDVPEQRLDIGVTNVSIDWSGGE